MSEPKHQLTAIDLFCGCGGLTLGLKEAGFRVLGAVELDPQIVQTYSSNHPEVTVWNQDIRTLDPKEVMMRLHIDKGELSLLAGCPPCQGFSSMRTRNGKRSIFDERNFLIRDFLRFIKEFSPRAIMVENVPALAKDKLFDEFLHEIRKLDYRGEFRVLDAAFYGVPQRRKRLILMAGHGFKIPYAAPNLQVITVRSAIGGLLSAGKSGDILHDTLPVHSDHVMELIHNVPHDGGSRKDLPERFRLACHVRSNGFSDVYGRMAWDKVAPTITSGCCNPSKGRFLHPEEDRAITMREAALLQGFPLEYTFKGKNRGAITLMIGNALPPPFIKAHALEIKKTIG